MHSYFEYLQKRYRCKLWNFLFSEGRSKLIYGKGMQARLVYETCQLLGIHIEAFVSTTEEVFVGSVDNEKNYTIDSLPEMYAESDILICVNEKWNDVITDGLVKRGFNHIYTVPEWEPINRLFQTHLFHYMAVQGKEDKADYKGGIVRLCDGFEEKIKLEEYTRQRLLEKIHKERLENVLFHVYDKDDIWQGTIEFSDLFFCDEDWTQNIYREKIRFDSAVFEHCNTFFARYPWRTFVPIYWDDDTVACMAWLERPVPWGVFDSQMQTVNNLKTARKEDVALFFMDIGEVCLYGVNEMSYQIYSILKEKQIPYRIEGRYWRLLGDSVYKEEINKPDIVKGLRKLNVYAESQYIYSLSKSDERFYNREQVFWNYEWLNTLCKVACARIADRMVQKLLCHGIAASFITVPESAHLRKVTEEESYDSQHDVCLHADSKTQEVWNSRCAKIYKPKTIEKYLAGKLCEGRFFKSRQNLVEWSVTEEERRNHIYMIGPCVVAQTDLPTEDTIVAQMQKKIDAERPGQYKVSGICLFMVRFELMEKVVNSIDFRDGDICLFIFNITDYKSKYEVPLDKLFDTRMERWFSNAAIHLNETGSEKATEYIFENCVKLNLKSGIKKEVVLYASELDTNEWTGVKMYTDKYRDYMKKGKCGCIVMNCNPYTYGHDYLIENASRRVDWLYIFVVEEDASYFPFEDRIALVKKNTDKYHNVIVLPSGNMILSAETMPSYFMKETQQEMEIDATKDLRLFGLGIAPVFGITVRFAGEEPIDKVTAQYNMEMKKRLPNYGIEFVEMPRQQLGGGIVISASKVRELLKNNELENIKEYVPECTWDYLVKLYKEK